MIYARYYNTIYCTGSIGSGASMASFVQVIAWAFLVAFIRVAGYSAVAEKVSIFYNLFFIKPD